MTKTSLIEKIKSQLKNLVNNKFAEVKAGDLMITSPDEILVVGSEVFTPDADGNNIPLTDGEYILDEGYKIVVVSGKITEISEKETEVEASEMAEVAPAEEPAPAPTEEDKPDMTEEMKKIAERLAKCEEMIVKMMEDKKMMEAQFSALAASPAAPSIEAKPAEFKSIEDRKVGMLDILSIREKVRKNR